VAAAARDLRVDGTVLITVAAEQAMSESNEMKSIVSEPRWRNMFVTSTLSSVMNAASGVLNAICDGTALRYSSPRDCFIFVVSCGWPAINLVETRCWHVTISCQPDGRPPQPV